MNDYQHISDLIKIIHENTSYLNLTNQEKLILISNLMLLVSIDNLPDEYQNYPESFLNNSKEIAMALQKHPTNEYLQLAMKAHLIIDISSKV